MPDLRYLRDIKKCLYLYDSGIIQLNVQRLGPKSNNNSSWTALVEQSTDSGNDAPAPIASQITYINGVKIVSAEDQFYASPATIYCHLLHLYPTASISETSSEFDVSWGAYDTIITLLQTRFRHCKNIMLVLWTDPTISLSKREAGQENDAMLAWLEKVLIRVDELHRTLAQQGCEFSIFPSPAAFELCIDQAKKSGGIFEEGDWDHNRVAESRVWRSVEPQLGYWIRTSFYDMFERNDMGFVWGSLMKSKVETGSQATFYDQTTTFRTSGNDGIFRGESDTGATFQCTVDYDHDPITIEMVDRPEKIGWTYMWKCWANINAWENTPVS